MCLRKYLSLYFNGSTNYLKAATSPFSVELTPNRNTLTSKENSDAITFDHTSDIWTPIDTKIM